MRAGRLLVIPLLALAGAAVTPAEAAPSSDTTGPAVTIPEVSAFVVGQQVSDVQDNEPYLWFADGGAMREYRWRATDPSGVCGYTIDEEHSSEGWYDSVVVRDTRARTGSYQFFADEFGNSDDLSAIRLNVRDCVGNVTSVVRPGDYTHVERDYGPALAPGWSRVNFVGAIGDTMLRTSVRGASLSTVVNAQGGHLQVGLVMAKGPARGVASILVDGVPSKTVDTYAPANTNRIVVWTYAFSGSANHTIRVVNLATPGRARIDIDAYIR